VDVKKEEDSMTDVHADINDRAARARKMMKGATLKAGTYAFVKTGKPKLLDPKDDKPRTITVDVAPLADEGDKGTTKYDFKRTLWVKLIGVEGYDPQGNEARGCIETIDVLVPGRIDPLTKENGQWTFRGQVVKGKDYEEAQVQRALQAMDVAQELVENPDLITDDVFFYGTIKAGKEEGSTFLNNLTTTRPAGTIAVPEEA
jgi:hypothetical protein